MRSLTFLLCLLLFVSCDSKSRLQRQFSDCLTPEQIEVIIEFNAIQDKLVRSLFPKARNLTEAYLLYSTSILDRGGFEDSVLLLDDQIELLKAEIEKAKLTDELFSNTDDYDVNLVSNYLTCFHNKWDFSGRFEELYDMIYDSGSRNVTFYVIALQNLAQTDDIDTPIKLLVTFELVVGQIEMKQLHTTNKL